MAPSSQSKAFRGRSGKTLEGQVAIISGATGGVGEATARRFAEEGARVVIHFSGRTERSIEKANKIVKELRKDGFEALSLKANVSKYSEVKSLVDQVVSKWGKVSSIVALAGLPSSLEFWQENPLNLADEELLSAIKVDFVGSYHFIKAARSHMRREHFGKIVLISSSPTIYGDDAGFRYILGKDLNRMTVKSLAMKLIRDDGIYLNTIAPGTIDTPANRINYSKEGWNELVSQIPTGRAGLPEDIAGAALFLCSHDSDFVVGQTLVVDGGEVRL